MSNALIVHRHGGARKGDDPIAYVVSANLHRRDLTTTQKAMCAGRARAMYDEQAKERKREAGGRGGKASGASRRGEAKDMAALPYPSPDAGPSRDKTAKAFGVSGRTVDFATKVL